MPGIFIFILALAAWYVLFVLQRRQFLSAGISDVQGSFWLFCWYFWWRYIWGFFGMSYWFSGNIFTLQTRSRILILVTFARLIWYSIIWIWCQFLLFAFGIRLLPRQLLLLLLHGYFFRLTESLDALLHLNFCKRWLSRGDLRVFGFGRTVYCVVILIVGLTLLLFSRSPTCRATSTLRQIVRRLLNLTIQYQLFLTVMTARLVLIIDVFVIYGILSKSNLIEGSALSEGCLLLQILCVLLVVVCLFLDDVWWQACTHHLLTPCWHILILLRRF